MPEKRAARARGVKFGRPPKEHPEAYEAVLGEWEQGAITARKAAERLGVTHKTFLKWAAISVNGEKSTGCSPQFGDLSTGLSPAETARKNHCIAQIGIPLLMSGL